MKKNTGSITILVVFSILILTFILGSFSLQYSSKSLITVLNINKKNKLDTELDNIASEILSVFRNGGNLNHPLSPTIHRPGHRPDPAGLRFGDLAGFRSCSAGAISATVEPLPGRRFTLAPAG